MSTEMDRFVCVHGHFYQPPRENPWLEFIEVQDSAYPDHDWNERVDRQCYGPNAAARVLDSEGRISKIVNNYARMSFNIGPTLFEWLERHDPAGYAAILSADAESRERYSGHGSAIAQPYNHMIMPLANRRDRSTQVLWGIRDFEHRFQRRPEGMWLPETAVDRETLEVLAEHGIRFTILGQHQAERVRDLNARTWEDVRGGTIDATQPYQVQLASGRAISVFFYDERIAKAVAFEGILHRGEYLAERLASAFSDLRAGPQLVNIAADGETYGHHHRFGEMALAYALDLIESAGKARLTNYAAFLDGHPPEREVAIAENTSWSCTHGIERWRSDCGCHTGGAEGWNQTWRKPLRAALDGLRDRLAPAYERAAAGVLRDPWIARDDYIGVILNRSPAATDAFLNEHGVAGLDEAARRRALRLLEMQRNLMLMYTSCGWFFSDLAGIETVQILQYAARAIELAEGLIPEKLEPAFLAQLAAAKSNTRTTGSGRTVYERLVLPGRVDLEQVAAHYTIRSFFESFPPHARLFCYSVDLLDEEDFQAGEAALRVGRLKVQSEVTGDASVFRVLALRLDGNAVGSRVRVLDDGVASRELASEVTAAFRRQDPAEAARLMESLGCGPTISIHSLFHDEQRKIMDEVIWGALASDQPSAHDLAQRPVRAMQTLSALKLPLPPGFHSLAEVALSLELRAALAREAVDSNRILKLIEEAHAVGLGVDSAGLAHALERGINLQARRFARSPEELGSLRRLESLVGLSRTLAFDMDPWEAQNAYFGLLESVYPKFREGKGPAEIDPQEWTSRFLRMADELALRVP